MSRLTLEVNSDSHSLECITFFKLCHLLQMNLQLAKKSHPLSHPSTKLNSFHLWQSWELPTGTHWWVATHSMGTNFNLLLISYCVCLALQTSDCLTCTSVHSGANIKQPMKKKTPALLRFLQNHAGTYSGVSTLWCKKRELLRVSRQHSAVCHRTAHKETC